MADSVTQQTEQQVWGLRKGKGNPIYPTGLHAA